MLIGLEALSCVELAFVDTTDDLLMNDSEVLSGTSYSWGSPCFFLHLNIELNLGE